MRMAVVRAMAVALPLIMTVITAVLMAMLVAMLVRMRCAGWRHLRIKNPIVTIESNPLSGCES